jgi:DME family drug/metabolite transporter
MTVHAQETGYAATAMAHRGLLLVCAASLLWSTVGVASRMMTAGALDPALSGWSRTLLGGLAILLVARLLRRPTLPLSRWPVGGLLQFAASGAVFQTTLFAGFHEIGVTVTVAVTVVLPPVIVAAACALAERRCPPLGILAAIAIGAIGVGLALFGRPDAMESPGLGLYGALLLTVNAVAFVAMTAALRRVGAQLGSMWAAGAGLVGVSLALLPAAIVLAGPAAIARTVSLIDLGDGLILVYTGIVATGGAYVAFAIGMSLSPTPVAGLAATMIEPVFAAILAALVLGEALSAATALGCLLTLVAMALLFVSSEETGKSAS